MDSLAGVEAGDGGQLELVARDEHCAAAQRLEVLHQGQVVVGLHGVPAGRGCSLGMFVGLKIQQQQRPSTRTR